MPTTPSGFRYPALADVPNVPQDLRNLAEDVDDFLPTRDGAAWVCTSGTRPPHAAGLRIWETDTGLQYVSSGSAWLLTYRDTGWTTSGLVWGSGWSAVASGTWASFAYRVVGQVVYLNGTVTKATTWAANETVVTLPVGIRPRGQYENSGARLFATGVVAKPTAGGAGVTAIDISFLVA